jgi:hypothetical protein
MQHILRTVNQVALELIYMLFALVMCTVINFHLGGWLDVSRLDTSILKKKLVAQSLGGSLYSLRLPTSGLGPRPAHSFDFEVLGAHP